MLFDYYAILEIAEREFLAMAKKDIRAAYGSSILENYQRGRTALANELLAEARKRQNKHALGIRKWQRESGVEKKVRDQHYASAYQHERRYPADKTLDHRGWKHQSHIKRILAARELRRQNAITEEEYLRILPDCPEHDAALTKPPYETPAAKRARAEQAKAKKRGRK